MSTVNVSVDTEKKKLEVSVDGKKIANASEVWLYDESSVIGFGVEIVSKEKQGDLRKVTRLVAKHTEKANKALNEGIGVEVGDFVEYKDKHDVIDEVSNYIDNNE